MENASSNALGTSSSATASETPVLGSAENVGPAGRRAETPWNSRDRQREFGALDADVMNRTVPPPEPRRPKPTEPTPTWPIAVGLIAILGVGVGVLLHHGGGSSATTNAVASPTSAPTQPPVVKVVKPTGVKKPIAVKSTKEPVVVRATSTPAPPKVVIVKETTNAATPAPRTKPPRAVIVVRATPEPHRPAQSDRPAARPRPAATPKAPVHEIAVATPRPAPPPHKEAAPKAQAPNLHLPSSNGDDSEINDKANKLLGGG